ncbi:sugar transferase [uncultured Amnibacterium sp.]|uniref:sugar transferase n=1 Tax=uncultured Amnibacterium sp. TaxID=1631851 RepID=UPI0035CBF5CB
MTTSPLNIDGVRAVARPLTYRRWTTRYALRLLATDLLVVAGVVLAAHWLWLGEELQRVPVHTTGLSLRLTTAQLSFVIAGVWIAALGVFDSRDEREIGNGPTEYRRVIGATAATFALTLVGVFFLGFDLSRGFVITVFGGGVVALVVGRWIWRKWLSAARRAGTFSHRVVLIGSTATVTRTAGDLAREQQHGYRVVGAALTDGPDSGHVAGLPIVGDIEAVPNALRLFGADTVMATSSDELTPQRIRDLAWHLEPRRHQLVLAPGLTDVGGSRIHLRPVAGLPLIHVETPHLPGSGRYIKRTFDVLCASLALLVIAPVFAVIAVAVRRDSAGPVFYTQERIGRDGEPFRIVKFRSMTADADARRAELVTGTDKGLFKLVDDPRVTRVGRVLRRYSLDELPQLLNVLRGDMSLVGPRPALPDEVSEYDRHELRRLAVTPGLSGLWQVSGRSDLPWADGIRLDLYYVENWSLTQDLVILWRTVRAVVRSEGAY